MGRNINIITDIDGNKVVMINSIIFNCTCWFGFSG